MTIDALIAEAERLCAAATPGPWSVTGWHSVMAAGSTDTYAGAVYGAIATCEPIEQSDFEGRTWTTGGSQNANAAFIARSRTLIPELVAALRQRSSSLTFPPAREEVERRLRELWRAGTIDLGQDAGRHHRNALIRDLLRDLGYGDGR